MDTKDIIFERKNIQQQLDMDIEDLLSCLESIFLPLSEDDDPDIDLLVIRRLKQYRLKSNNEKINKRITVLVGEIDPLDPDDNEDYSESDSE